jgi:hypothetical protein
MTKIILAGWIKLVVYIALGLAERNHYDKGLQINFSTVCTISRSAGSALSCLPLRYRASGSAPGSCSILIPRPAPIWRGRHRYRCRDIAPCSQFWCGQAEAERRADSRCDGKSAWPWYVAASVCRTHGGRARSQLPCRHTQFGSATAKEVLA